MVDAGIIVWCACVAVRRRSASGAQAVRGPGEFLEVFVDTLCRSASNVTPGPYAKSAGDPPTMSGVKGLYEVPDRPDVHVDGRQPIRHSAAAVIDRLGPISQFD